MVLRPLSTTAPRPRKRDEDEEDQEAEEEERVFENYGEVYAEFLRSETMTEAEKAEARKAMEMWEQLPIEEKNKLTQNVKDIREGIDPLRKTQRAIRGSFWNEEERDSEMITNEFGEDDFEEDDITGMGHAKLEEHREMREYARIAVWEMPLLSSESRLSSQPIDGQRTNALGRTREAIRTPIERPGPAIPVHVIHGRIPPSREEGRGAVLSQRLGAHGAAAVKAG